MSIQRADRLSIFTFLWAFQTLAHKEFYSDWLVNYHPLGWILTIIAIASLIFPKSLRLFSGLLIFSLAYYLNKWPFVGNHVLADSLMSLTILVCIVTALFSQQSHQLGRQQVRDQIFDRFAPVVTVMLVLIYYFAFLAKLNHGFLDAEFSAAGQMYSDLVRQIPFLPTGKRVIELNIGIALSVELLIPLMLTFRRLAPAGIMIGLPFHLMLGLIGHRTFSIFVYCLYALFIIDPLTSYVSETLNAWRSLLGKSRWQLLLRTCRLVVVLGAVLLIGSELTRYRDSGIGPLTFPRIAKGIWILSSVGVAFVYLKAIRMRNIEGQSSLTAPVRRPGLLWAMPVLLALNCLSPYLGLKTKNTFTMYSNLRVEGNWNNHLFMPALRLTDYMDDLVDIVETDDPKLRTYRDNELLITHFELRRIVTTSDRDLFVRYEREAAIHEYDSRTGVATDPQLLNPIPLLAGKLLYFRPVDKREQSRCLH